MAINIIDSYRFGQIVVNGKNYTSDVIIFSERVKDNWWRKVGHQLHPDDLGEVIAENPDVLVVGTGAEGLMRIPPEVEQSLKAQGIKIIAKPTEQACHVYNQLCHSQKVVAALHLTC